MLAGIHWLADRPITKNFVGWNRLADLKWTFFHCSAISAIFIPITIESDFSTTMKTNRA